tara:strand:- start:889 stop:1395 length:507 start_codon:yes stop_codon:yes gene_type:complete
MIDTIKEQDKIYVVMGECNEKRITNFIYRHYGDNIKRTGNCNSKSHWNKLDFKGDKTYVEVKSRSKLSTQFNTTMIGYNKILEYEKKYKQGYRCFFIFMFIDGTYEWEYTPENYEKNGGYDQVAYGSNTFTTNKYTSFNPNKLNCYIFMDNLTFLTDITSFVPNKLKC